MKIVIVDDDKAMLLIINRILSKIEGIEIVKIFNNSRDALEFIKDYNIDIAFLDINMPGENGIELAKKILNASPITDVVFTTSYTEYAVEAFEICAFDYIVKPITHERLKRTIKRALEKRLLLNEKTLVKKNNISVYLLGGIDVSSKSFGTVKWASAKSMELFVYLLLNKGRNIAKNIIIEDIFQRMPLKNAENYLKTAVYQIRKAFEPHVSNSILVLNNGYYKLECDDFYIDFLELEKRGENLKEIDESNVKEALEAEKLFSGDLLGDRAYYWSIAEREKYLSYYLKLAKKLGTYLFNIGEINETYYILKKILKFDPFNEEANCLFMRIFAVQRNRKSLLKHYEGYVKMIKKELGVYPDSAILNLYEKLVNSFND